MSILSWAVIAGVSFMTYKRKNFLYGILVFMLLMWGFKKFQPQIKAIENKVMGEFKTFGNDLGGLIGKITAEEKKE